MKRFIGISICIILVGVFVFAKGAGSAGAAFLKIGLGARPASMGFSFSAIADDINAIWYNPAGLSQFTKIELATTYLRYFQDINYGFLAFAYPNPDLGVFATSISYLSITGIEKRNEDTEEPESTFGASDINFILSYATNKLVNNLSVGANLKVFTEKLEDTSAYGFAVDLAGLYTPEVENLTIGFGIYNLGMGLKFKEVRDKLPLLARVAASYKLFDKTLTISSDFEYGIIDEKWYLSFGAEYWIMNMFAIRAGYRLNTDLGVLSGLGVGAGIKLNNPQIGLDYGFVPMGDLGSTHRISLSFKF
jgi:long-subunit fatty acid transport protein